MVGLANQLSKTMKTFYLASICIFYSFACFAQWTQIGTSLSGDSPEDTFGDKVSINATGDIIAVGAPINDIAGDDYGQVKIFKFENNNWIQMGASLYGNMSPQAGEKFGWAIDLSDSGLRLVVGSPFYNDGNTQIPGAMKVFDYNGTDWIQVGSTIEGENNQDLLGWDVAINNDGSRIIAGSIFNNDNGNGSGQATVYEYSGSDWIQLGNDIEGQMENLYAGDAVDISGIGNRVAVGYPNTGPPSGPAGIGEVRIFELNNDIWVQVGGTIFEEFSDDDFGRVISLDDSGNRVALGARIYSGTELFSGQVRVFELQTNNWEQLGSTLEGEGAEALGTSVDLNSDGTILVAGGRANNPINLQSGIVRIFRYINNDWEQYDDSIFGVAAEDHSGRSVGINNLGDIVVMGAPFNDDNGSNSGHARAFFNEDILSVSGNEFLVSTILYPNPNNGSFSLKFPESLGDITISIIDATGKTLSSEMFSDANDITVTHNLTTGIYFVSIISNLSEAIIKMIVK